jgi:hypothetical protein
VPVILLGTNLEENAPQLRDTELLLGAEADMALEAFQDRADGAVELLYGAEVDERTEISEVATEGRPAPWPRGPNLAEPETV